MLRSRLVSLAVIAAIVFGACGATTLPAPAGSQAPGAPSGTSSSKPGGAATEAPAATPPETEEPTDAPEATPAPTSKATPAPTPEPTGAPTVDASAAFVDVMGDPLLTANVTFTGTSTLGSTITPRPGPWTSTSPPRISW